jgi:hypothetical protein
MTFDDDFNFGPNSGGVIFEIVRVGAYAKVVAIDAMSGREATVVGPARGHDESLKRMAIQKLRRAMQARPDGY